jgi:hypothetical protein
MRDGTALRFLRRTGWTWVGAALLILQVLLAGTHVHGLKVDNGRAALPDLPDAGARSLPSRGLVAYVRDQNRGSVLWHACDRHGHTQPAGDCPSEAATELCSLCLSQAQLAAFLSPSVPTLARATETGLPLPPIEPSATIVALHDYQARAPPGLSFTTL